MDSTINHYLETVKNQYPDLVLQDLHLLDPDGGQYNDVITAESDHGPLIFRFPRNEFGVKTIENELVILGNLQGKTSLPVPNPVYRSHNSHTPGQVFMGYPMLPGEPLLRSHLQQEKNPDNLKKWAEQMARFLVELHSLSIDGLEELPVNETVEEYKELYADIEQHLFPHMSERLQNITAEHFDAYFNNPALQSYPVALRHGDFGTGNVLYDPDTLDLTAVIDFGFAGLGDPAVDLAGLSTLGDDFFDFVTAAYPDIEPLLARGRFYKGTFLLYEALYGLKSGSQEIFQEALTAYKAKHD